MSAPYNKDLRRLLLHAYNFHSFQYIGSEMFVAEIVDSLDVLIRKSLHACFYTCLVKYDNHIIKSLSGWFICYASPYMEKYIESVYTFS